MGLAFVSFLLKVKKMFGTVNPCFLFFMNKISFYFCDLFIVMMLRNQSYPPNKSIGQGLTQRQKVLWVTTWLTDFDLECGKDNNVNKHKKLVNTYKKSLYVWCWFVMFASESSHASSFKNSWICEFRKTATKKCTTRIHALGSDDATS